MDSESHVIIKQVSDQGNIDYHNFFSSLFSREIINESFSDYSCNSKEISLVYKKIRPSINLHFDEHNEEIYSEKFSKTKLSRLIFLRDLKILILIGDFSLNKSFLRILVSISNEKIRLNTYEISSEKILNEVLKRSFIQIRALKIKNLVLFEKKIKSARLEIKSNSDAFDLIKKVGVNLIGLELSLYVDEEFYIDITINPIEGTFNIFHKVSRLIDIEFIEEFIIKILGDKYA